MNKLSVKGLNGLILRNVIEIVVLSMLIFVSYWIFDSSNLSASASVAKASTSVNNATQVLYGRTSVDISDVLSSESLIDKGTLTIKNTNNKRVNIEIILSIENKEFDLNNYSFEFSNTKVDEHDVKSTVDGYELSLGSLTLEPYETFKDALSVYGNPYTADKFEYTFKIIESFYE